MAEICEGKKCTGCKACLNICPKDAIFFQENSVGIEMPTIYAEKCIDCGLCKKVCPVNSNIELNEPIKCYAVVSNNLEHRLECSSGGIAAALTDYTIKKQGYVCGSVVGEDAKLIHLLTNDKNEVKRFRGSKYVQSDIGNAYKEIKDKLLSHKVTFIGTPCQVAGLRNYLNKDYDNLLCVDFVCHGVPPIKYLKEWIQYVTKKDKKITDFSFRGKEDFHLIIKNKETIIYNKKKEYDGYFYSFLQGLIHRENCYICPYAQAHRTGDITIGDFWGLDRKSLKIDYQGKISLAFINTSKGRKVFENLIENNLIIAEERSIDEAIRGNDQLKNPSVKHSKRNRFIFEYKKCGFIKALKKSGIQRKMFILRVKSTKLYQSLRTILKRNRKK